MRSYTLVFFLCAVSYFSYGQKSVSFSLGPSSRSLQAAANRRDVFLDYTSVGAQFSYFTSPKAELFSGLSYGSQSGGDARFASGQVGMRYFLPLNLPERFRFFGQFSGELLFDNSYAITNRDVDFVGSAGTGFDFKIASSLSLRTSVNLGLPFFSSGTLSPFANSGSNFSVGIGLVFQLPAKKTSEALILPVAPTQVSAVVPDTPVKDDVATTIAPSAALGIAAASPIVPAVVQEATAIVSSTPNPIKSREKYHENDAATLDSIKVVKTPAKVAKPSTVAEVSSKPKALDSIDLDSLFKEEIFFKTDKSWVGPESAKKLDRIIGLMAQYPTVSIHLKGHTDYRKSDKYNFKLSVKRVENVRLYFVKHGISADRFKVEAFSEEVPASKTDLQLNRRVEVRIWR